jgi:hypothetical protein
MIEDLGLTIVLVLFSAGVVCAFFQSVMETPKK